MKVVNYLPFDDIGGSSYRTATAFNRYRPDWEYLSYCGAPSYLHYPQHSPWHWDTIVNHWNSANVVHVHDHIPRVGKRKPTVVTFHGTGFREQPDKSLQLVDGATVLVSTLDLWLLKPETTWMPQIDDLDWLATFRKPRNGKRLRIAHAPTNRPLKSTDQLLAACENLPVDVVLIEGKSWAECLRIKGTCDVLFDQTMYGYGGNTVEAWGMGIPVICGAPDPVLAEYESRFGQIPFLTTTTDTIRQAVEAMLEPEVRNQWAAIGRAHAERFHSQQAGVERLTPIYEAATARR